jgi:hypothetical protein
MAAVKVVGIELVEYAWGPTRKRVVELEKLGYHVEEARYPLGVSVLILSLPRRSSPAILAPGW